MSEFHHVSVLLWECIDGLGIKPDGIYVDGTLGGAGHSSQIAARLTSGTLIGIDRDPVALQAAGERLAPYGDRVKLVQDLDALADRMVEQAIQMAKDYSVMEVQISVPQTVMVMRANY